jgi:2-keto-4-pentenoate hydratase
MDDEALARLLLEARHGGPPVPADAAALDEAQAYRVQRLVMAELGEIGGWKVGAPGPDGPISCAPLPQRAIFHPPITFDSTIYTQREVESEICFRIARDLPRRPAPYTHHDVFASIATCHPGIEILQSRLADPAHATPVALLADSIQNGAFVVGSPIADFGAIDGADIALRVPTGVEQTISNGDVKTATANPAGDMLRLLAWLANTGAVWAGGLRAGQVVTCGSWTGKTYVLAGGTVTTVFAGQAPLWVRFT